MIQGKPGKILARSRVMKPKCVIEEEARISIAIKPLQNCDTALAHSTEYHTRSSEVVIFAQEV